MNPKPRYAEPTLRIGNVSWSSGSTAGTKAGHHGDFVSWTLASGSSGTKVFAGTDNVSAATARTIKG